VKLVLRADSIGKSFGGRTILTAATLRATAGEIGFLVGRNGSGKSTLLRVASGTLVADHGVVTYDGVAYLHPRWPVLARRGLCYLPDRAILSPSRTVRAHLTAIVRQFDLDSYVTAAELCDIVPFLDRRCADLSTGERRRVEVATAVARAPRCLLVDEPFRHVDPPDRTIIGPALRRLASQGCAIIVTGHDVDDLFELADSVVWCASGTTQELGGPAAAAQDWRFAREYLGAAALARTPSQRVTTPSS
jgi:ABC-type multidrug transport system ATPase subunit